MAIFPKWKNIQILSCFMFITISRPNQGRLNDNNSDSGLCSYVEPNRSLQWRQKTPQNAAKRLKTPQNTAKRCELLKPGMLYDATSRAKTIGTVTPKTPSKRQRHILDRFRNVLEQSTKHKDSTVT